MTNSEDFNRPRRTWLHAAAGIAVAAPLGMFATKAVAAQNAPVRQALKYQDTPKPPQQCSNCAQFVAGKTAKDAGGCTVIPGDTEIAPAGWCVAWIELKKK